MTELLVTNVEQRQPRERNDTEIVLFGRSASEPSERKRVVARGFDPYFYASRSEVDGREAELVAYDCIAAIDVENEYESLKGKPLRKITVPRPQDTREARAAFDETWEADVPFTNRFRIDTGVRAYIEVGDEHFSEGVAVVDYEEIEPLEQSGGAVSGGLPSGLEALERASPRTVTMDIEVDDRGDEFPSRGEERILSVVAHDSIEDEVVAFFDGDGRNVYEMFPSGAPQDIDQLFVHDSEGEMLSNFADWFAEQNPDLLTGWNVADFDATYLIERMDALRGVEPSDLSNMGWAGISGRGDPRIKGCTIYDLLTVYKRNSRTELRSYKLDDVAKEELGAEKISFDGTYYELYQDDPDKFIRYNAHDVILTKDINEEAGVIAFRDRLRRQVGVDFEDSYDPKDFADMMCRRKLRERGVAGPTRPDYGETESSDYEGGTVLDPYEGVAENVVGIDLASLYPYTMAMLNASPETKVESAEGVSVAEAAGGQLFRQDEDGLFREIIFEALGLKSDYKDALRDDSLSKEETEQLERSYMAAKVVVNSLYGVTGWEHFFLYDKDVAEAVTLTGQAVIRKTAQTINEQGYNVIYGDTDSCYIKFPDEWDRDECIGEAHDLAEWLNEEVYPAFCDEFSLSRSDNLWEIEVEAYLERFFQAGKKKRYAYIATWKDGHEVAEPEPTVKGFSSKRSDSAEITVDTEEAIFEVILTAEGDIKQQVGDIIFKAAREIEPTAPDWGRIGIPGGFNKKITDDPAQAQSDNYYAVRCDSNNCYPQDAHPRAAYNANKILGTDITSGDKPKRVYIEDTFFEEIDRYDNVIGFIEASDLSSVEEELRLDVNRMTEVIIKRPLREIVGALGVDVGAAVKGMTQEKLGAFKK